jgi:hypothetical protein
MSWDSRALLCISSSHSCLHFCIFQLVAYSASTRQLNYINIPPSAYMIAWTVMEFPIPPILEHCSLSLRTALALKNCKRKPGWTGQQCLWWDRRRWQMMFLLPLSGVQLNPVSDTLISFFKILAGLTRLPWILSYSLTGRVMRKRNIWARSVHQTKYGNKYMLHQLY